VAGPKHRNSGGFGRDQHPGIGLQSARQHDGRHRVGEENFISPGASLRGLFTKEMQFHAPQDLNPVAGEEPGMPRQGQARAVQGGLTDESSEALLARDELQFETLPVLAEKLVDRDLRRDDVADGSHDGVPSSDRLYMLNSGPR
jgi:hypothetical protein